MSVRVKYQDEWPTEVDPLRGVARDQAGDAA